MAVNEDGTIQIPYLPRKHFRPLHASQKRWMFVCAHRRAGKTVALANHLIRAATLNTRRWPPPRYGYVGPSFDQAKDLVWGYLHQYTDPLEGTRHMEGDLATILPNGAIIKLYGGAAAYERMRGMYFDGIVLDEYPLLNPAVFSTVVRPCLADYHGWGIVSGTSNGDDHFNHLRLRAENDPRWDMFIIPIEETGEEALTREEVEELAADMTPEEFSRELSCSFDAPVEGSYYGEMLNKLALEGRIGRVPIDLSQPVITAWDLGIHDYCCIWFYQICGRELHFVDYIQDNGKGLDFYCDELERRAFQGKYHYKAHCLPHDVEAREQSTGRTRRDFLMERLNAPVHVGPLADPEDGINAARNLLGLCWFDQERCRKGLQMLRGYHRSRMGKPVHGPGPHSHGADAFRCFATTFHLVGGFMGRMGRGAIRRKIRGVI